MSGTRYVNLRTNALVESFNEGSASFTIATVTDDGYGRRRKVRSAAFHNDYLARDGQPHSSGYVPVNTLPGDHPRAMKTEMSRMELLDHLDKLSNAELAGIIMEHQRAMDEAKTVVERAKAVIKSRNKEPGWEVHGDVTFVLSGSGEAFDGATALRNLSKEDVKKISVLKPDAKKAQTVFKDDPAKLKLCMKGKALTLTVRETTDEDRLKVLNQRDAETAGGDEVFDDILSDLPTF